MPRRKANARLPEAPVTARIESCCHDGRGLTHLDGRVTFVEGALPGERVEFVYTEMKRDFACAKTIRVLEASPLRVAPKCEYFGICGGCTFQHVDPERQIEVKQQILEDQLRRIAHLNDIPIWPPIRGPSWAYRHKARLSVKYVPKKGRALVGFNEKATRLVADIGHCEVLNSRIGNKLADIAELVTNLSIRDRIPQIEIAVGEPGSCVLVFRNLCAASAEDRVLLKDFGAKHDFAIYLQPGGPDSLCRVDQDAALAMGYTLPAHNVRLEFKALQFTQVNFELNRRMV
ncbi:MAG: 23S rRNA (uracil(1939)-C(5))-methyltransferase RlmD, partial [Methylococcales bacterium]